MNAADTLLKRIECLRSEMTNVAMDKGFTSPDAIKISQELDKLLNLYGSMKQTGSRENVK